MTKKKEMPSKQERADGQKKAGTARKPLVLTPSERRLEEKIRKEREAQRAREKQYAFETEAAIVQRVREAQERREILGFFSKLLSMILFLVLLFHLVFGVHLVRGNDMKPAVLSGDVVLFFRLERDFKAHEAVVYEADGKQMVGRVVGRPGDLVEITESGQLLINGYVSFEENIYYKTGRIQDRVQYPLRLSGDSYFILSDYRESVSFDSRYNGAVQAGKVFGKVFLVLRFHDF